MMTAALRAALLRPILRRADARLATRPDALPSGASPLARVLLPDGVDLADDGRAIQTGDSWQATLEVQSFPPEAQLTWLHATELCAPGVTVHQRIAPVPDALARRILTQSSNAAISTLASDDQDGRTQDATANAAVDDAGTLLRALVAGSDRLIHYAVTVTISAPSRAALDARVIAIRDQLRSDGVMLRVCQFEQWAGLMTALPLGQFLLTRTHAMSGAVAAMGMPTATGGLRPRPTSGLPILWGEHQATGEPVLWDRWQAANPHALVIAESGSGKTYTMSGLMAQELALGDDAILILDPKNQEYRRFTTALGGSYVTLSATAGYHINPLALPRLDQAQQAGVRALDEDLLGQRIGFVRALIVRELRQQGTVVDAVGQQLIDQAIRQAYTTCGIDRDPATFDRPMPVFSDVQGALAALPDPEASTLARALTIFTAGVVGDLFNAASSIPVDNPLLAIDLSALLKTQDETLQRLIPVIVMDFFVGVATQRPTGRRYHLLLDEAHALLHTEAGSRTLELIFRIGRSLGFKATVITQSLSDLTETDITRVLLENSRTKLILGLNVESDAIERATAILGLNAQETAYLRSCRMEKGVGSDTLLLADGDRVPLYVRAWPGLIHTLATL